MQTPSVFVTVLCVLENKAFLLLFLTVVMCTSSKICNYAINFYTFSDFILLFEFLSFNNEIVEKSILC